MNSRALSVSLLVLLASPALFAAPKEGRARKPVPSSLVVGTVSARPGQSAIVPIELRDRAGTPLGAERAFGERVQAISVRVVALPAGAVRSIAVRRAGATAGLETLFESRPLSDGGAGLLVSFDEFRSPLALATKERQGGVRIAEVVVVLAPTAKPGTRIELRLDPATTALVNQQGTIDETARNGWLELHDGLLRVAR